MISFPHINAKKKLMKTFFPTILIGNYAIAQNMQKQKSNQKLLSSAREKDKNMYSEHSTKVYTFPAQYIITHEHLNSDNGVSQGEIKSAQLLEYTYLLTAIIYNQIRARDFHETDS